MRIQHGHAHLKIHKLADGEETPLLLLHQVGGSAQDWIDAAPRWEGPVYALDFSGHGASDHLKGGGYYPEYHAAEADIALGAIGDRAVIAGMGLGAYAALMLAGARTDRVPAALLWPGRGVAGGGALPDFEKPDVVSIPQWDARSESDARRYRPGTDAQVSACEHDTRPIDYARDFAAAANALLLCEGVSTGDPVPPWWQTAAEAERARSVPSDLAAALTLLREYAA